MDEEALTEFVVEAHRNGYATTAAETDELGGKKLSYRAGDWRYVDRYFGSRAFVGTEIVTFEGAPVWGMSYRGEPVEDAVDHETVYSFLRDALAQVSLDQPFRGPEAFVGGSFSYRAETDGTISRFRGTETIEFADDVVYRGQYCGGIVD